MLRTKGIPGIPGILWELQTPEPREPTGGFQIPDIFMSWTVSLHCVVKNGENLRIAQQ